MTCCDRHRLTWDDGCGPLTRELLAAVDDTARALHSDAVDAGDPERVEIARTMIGLCELLAAVDDTARALHSDAVDAGDPERLEVARTMIGLCELLAERLPVVMTTCRRSSIRSARLGATSIDVSVSRSSGKIVELFLDVNHREGAPLVGFGHALARLGSLALQHGTPTSEVIRALAGTTGGAAEVTEVEGVERAESIPDLVAQLLELEARQ